MRVWIAAVTLTLCLGLVAGAADLSAIERKIRKEPRYQSTPAYCLMVFGKDARTRIWLVKDGPVLYADLNGNGDLTDKNEAIPLKGNSFHIDRINEKDGTVHRNFTIWNAFANTFRVNLESPNREQYVGYGLMERPTWGDKPADAPIVHFNGPMSLERYGPVLTLPRMKEDSQSRRFKLRVMVGTPGLGKGTFASYDEVCSENLGNLQADIQFPSGDPDRPIWKRMDLFHDG